MQVRSQLHWSGALVLLAAVPASAEQQLWLRQLGTAAWDGATVLVDAGAGRTFVVGYTEGSLGGPSHGNSDAWFALYDGSGQQLWSRQIGTSTFEEARGGASDGAGGLFVAGSTYGSFGGPNAGSFGDIWLARYDGAGNQLWIRQFGSPNSENVYAAAADGSGGVFLGGYTYGNLASPLTGIRDAWLAHYDGAGNQLWIQQFSLDTADACSAAAPDGSGGLYAGGFAEDGIAGASDAWLAHYDAAGNRTWLRQFGAGIEDRVLAATLAGSGTVFVTGVTTGSLGAPASGGRDAWLALYDASGDRLWIRQFGTNQADYATAIGLDGGGGVYVGGSTAGHLFGHNPNFGHGDAWLARVDSAGNNLWAQQFGTWGNEGVTALAPDGSTGTFVAGNSDSGYGGSTLGVSDVWISRYGQLSASLQCPADFVEIWNGGIAAGQTDPSRTGFATFADNCVNGAQLAHYDNIVPNTLENPGFPEVVITRLWALSDSCGTYLTCQQIITLISPSAQAGALALDLLPGQCPNTYEADASSTRIALVSSWVHDAASLSPVGLRLRRADGVGRALAMPPNWWMFNDLAQPFLGAPGQCHDLGGDGLVDVGVEVPNWMLRRAFKLADCAHGSTVELALQGMLLDGTAFDARDRLLVP